ncbi:hypothetical protein [Soonwooa sp.]|uniref:hypothetical protein n=1 Tax=Soonwooa sp. TaxID=1938592 RepID=UPI0028A72567|nr:hypothetical protein [Soonwooa sp.]
MNKISRINQYLLERYPTVWNTKIVWMLALALLFHLIFFGIGFFAHSDPQTLQKSRAVNDYFSNGTIFIHLIVSVLLLVGWLINMFKNNAFKNFYPVSSTKLFFQFVQYFVIILSCTSFYMSYMFADKLNINRLYPDTEMSKNIELINTTYPFLAQNYEDFTLGNRLYPKPFFDLYCETDIQKIERDKKYFVNYDRVYQYFEVYPKISTKKNSDDEYLKPEPEASNGTKIAYTKTERDKKIFYFKKNVVDLSSYILTTTPSFYNYSTIFYDQGGENFAPYYEGIIVDDTESQLSETHQQKRAKVNKAVADLLNSKNRQNFEKQFNSFFELAKKYKIRTNLDAKTLTDLVFYPDNFEVSNFTKKYKPERDETYDPYKYTSSDYATTAVEAAPDIDVAAAAVVQDGKVVDAAVSVKDFNPEVNRQLSPEEFFQRKLTNHYFYSDNLKQILENVDTIKNKDFFMEYIHVFLWISFCLATFILGFRVTGLRALLFSIITTGVLSLLIALLSFIVNFAVGGSFVEYFVLYAFFVTGLLILLMSITQTFSKFITSIAVNISLNTFVALVLLLFAIITKHQIDACRALPINRLEVYNCDGILDVLGMDITSFSLLIIGFIFIFLFTKVLRKWKAKTE